jgi:hypothetical protein
VVTTAVVLVVDVYVAGVLLADRNEGHGLPPLSTCGGPAAG